VGYEVRNKVMSYVLKSQHPSGMPVTNMPSPCLKRVSSICKWVTPEKGPDQPDYREKSMSKLTRIMVCEVNQKNSVNIEEDSKSSAETSTLDIPSYKYNDGYFGQRYVTELGGNNYDEDSLFNENESTNSKRLKFRIWLHCKIINLRKRPFYLKSSSILPLILQPTNASIWMPIP